MSTRIWTGGGIDRAQINRLAPTVISAGSGSFTVTLDNNTAVFNSTSTDDLATVCAGIVAAVNASSAPQFQEVTASTDDTYVYLTANTPGKPFTQTSSATGTSAALVTSTTTANKSTNDWADALNWLGGTVPIATDDVIIENTDRSILYGLDQSAIALTSLTIRETFTGVIGLPNLNADGGYYEYRDTVLTFSGITTLTITHNAGDSAGRFRITVGNNNCSLVVNGPIDSTPSDYGVVEWDAGTGTHTISVNNGSVSIAPDTQDSVTVSSLKAVDSAVLSGPSATITTAYLDGQCTAVLGKAPAALNMDGSSTAQVQSGAGTTVDLVRGTVIWQGGNITTLTVGPTAVFNGNEDKTAITITDTTLHTGGTISDANKRIAWTNGIDLYKCGLGDVTLDLGRHVTITPSVI